MNPTTYSTIYIPKQLYEQISEVGDTLRLSPSDMALELILAGVAAYVAQFSKVANGQLAVEDEGQEPGEGPEEETELSREEILAEISKGGVETGVR